MAVRRAVEDAPALTRTCLVTGASRGIGLAVATALSAAGHRVALTARDGDALAKAAAGLPGPALALPADVTDPAAPDALLDAVERVWGPVEVLVTAAGEAVSAPLHRSTDELLAAQLDLHLVAPFRLVRRAAPAMAAAGWGRVVVVASVAAKQGAPYVSAYTAAKHGALGLVRAAAAELAGTGVTVNAVCPGFVDTPMTERSVARIAERTGMSTSDARDRLAGIQPIGRLITPEEVARVALLLVQDTGAITGQGVNVDGGTVMS